MLVMRCHHQNDDMMTFLSHFLLRLLEVLKNNSDLLEIFSIALIRIKVKIDFQFFTL